MDKLLEIDYYLFIFFDLRIKTLNSTPFLMNALLLSL